MEDLLESGASQQSENQEESVRLIQHRKMSVFPEEFKKAQEISRREDNLQKFRTQLIEQNLQLQMSNISERIRKRKTRTLTQSLIKNSFIRDINKEDSEEDSFSTRSSLLTSQLIANEVFEKEDEKEDDERAKEGKFQG